MFWSMQQLDFEAKLNKTSIKQCFLVKKCERTAPRCWVLWVLWVLLVADVPKATSTCCECCECCECCDFDCASGGLSSRPQWLGVELCKNLATRMHVARCTSRAHGARCTCLTSLMVSIAWLKNRGQAAKPPCFCPIPIALGWEDRHRLLSFWETFMSVHDFSVQLPEARNNGSQEFCKHSLQFALSLSTSQAIVGTNWLSSPCFWFAQASRIVTWTWKMASGGDTAPVSRSRFHRVSSCFIVFHPRQTGRLAENCWEVWIWPKRFTLWTIGRWDLRWSGLRRCGSVFFSVKAKHMGCKVRVTYAVLQLFSASLMGGICGNEVMFLRLSDSWIQSIGEDQESNTRKDLKSQGRKHVFFYMF